MADNVTVTPGAGATIATDDVGGAQYQRVKIDLGGDGSGSPLVRGQQTMASSLPVAVASDQGTLSVALQASDATAGRVKITDGTDVADVLDLANANPVAVAIVDGSGDQITSFGGGTQYTEDAAAAANPVGNALIAVRDDARSGSLTSTNGDNIALRGTNAGEHYVKHVDAIAVTDNSSTLSVDDGGSTISVDDGGGSLTVDGSVSVSGTAAVSLAAGAATIGKAEDAASADADVGVPAMAIRKGTPANTSGTDGDYEMLQMSAGRLWTSATITDGSGNVIGATSNALDVNIKSGGGGGTQYTEDAAAAADPVGNALIVVRDDSRGGSLTSTNGDNVAVRGTNSGELYVKHVDAIPVTDNSGSLTVDGSVSVSGTAAVSVAAGAATIAKAEDAASADADVGVPAMAVRKATPANTSGTDGDYEMLQMSAGRLWASSDISLGGTAVAGNSGNANAGTIRVVLATDQPSFTNAVPVTVYDGHLNIGKAEDTASADLDVGVPAMAIRKATPANTSGTDGDYEMLQMSAGRLWASTTVTDGSGNVIGATSNALDVNLKSGGQQGGATTVTTSFQRPADTTAYAANDSISDSTSSPTSGGFTFTSAARTSGGSGIITDLIAVSDNDPATLLQAELWLYDSAATATNDNAAFAQSDADSLLLVGVVPFTLLSSQSGSGANSYAHVQNLNIGFACAGSANLRFKVKAKNAYTPASAEKLTFRLKIVQTN